MSIAGICSRSIDMAVYGDSTQSAAQRMHARNVGCLVAIDAESRPIGILTDRDLAVRVVGQGRDPASTRVGDVMTPSPRTVRETVEIEDALRFMRSGPFRRIPVGDAPGKLVGLISLDDVLQSLAGEF